MTLSGFTFRDAVMDDKPQLQALGLAAYRQHRLALGEENWQKMEHILSLANHYDPLLEYAKGVLCEEGDRVIGMAFLMPHGHPTALFEKEWSYIRMVGVDPAYSGLGIAKTLTRKCIDAARESGERYIALHTSEVMHAARHIYESLGFSILKEIEPMFGIRYWIYLMKL